ncbi:MAG: 23S rRNA (pseudouridine(1915)-N(3))-methyltransferase RlmH [Bryobacteraceae bacterium]|nr:23S rRNA (pseudouridine(1915)-N(3))-methyltransferase RlmH [Bryobacteraceae bacterium]
MRIYLYFMGKPRDEHANAMAAEYVKRVSRFAKCEMREVGEKFDLFGKHAPARKVMLDPAGRMMTSQEFATFLSRHEDEGRDVVFGVGGHDGLPEAWRSRADLLLSLSAMTWPHELARAMLAEQIYRAFTILRGHPYPR